MLAAAIVLSLLTPVAVAAEDQPRQQKVTFKGEVNGKEQSMQYLLYLPKDYAAKADAKFPVLLFLHGAGERGDNIERVKVHGPPKLIEKGKDFPFIVISPQCPANVWWDVDVLAALVDDVVRSHRADKSRLYVTGLSMGGFGTWAICSKYPDKFAAAAPICGAGNPKTVAAMKGVPTWAFHGDKDTAVKFEAGKAMVDALKAAGGDVQFTVYEGVGHDSWTATYNNAKLYEWLLSKSRK
jgi:predicted peptidase